MINPAQKGPATTCAPRSLLDALHTQVLAQRKNLQSLIQTSGDTGLGTWSRHFNLPWSRPLPASDPLFGVVYSYAQRLLGKTIAMQLTRRLEASPDILTANHQGVDYYSQTVQGTLLFALSRLMHPDASPSVFPVLACGNVPLHNLTFPRGILLARHTTVRTGPTEKRQTAVKIPIFPSRFQDTLVNQAPVYTGNMLQAARTRTLAGKTGLLVSEQKGVLDLLEQVYPVALQHANYSDQCVTLGPLVWKKLFAPELRPDIPTPVYLELERVTASLVAADLANTHSLLHALLFDFSLRAALLQELDGHTGCWSLKHLRHIRTTEILDRHHAAGTLFFWTVDRKGRKLPMDLIPSGSKLQLVPLGQTPRTRAIDWTPARLAEALHAGQILPSLFLSFTSLALARGMVCHGGIYQAEYLPRIQQGIIQALETAGMHTERDRLTTVRTDAFISGQNVAMASYNDGTSAPAGAVEIMTAGGLTRDHLQNIADMTVREASLAALPETFAPFLPDQWRSGSGRMQLTDMILSRLGDKLLRFDIP